MSEQDLIKQINFLKKEIIRLNSEFKDKKTRFEQEIENKYDKEINELKSRVNALTREDEHGGEEKEKLKNLKKKIKATSKTKSKALKEKLKEIKMEKKYKIKQIKTELKGCQKTLISLRKSKITQTHV